MFFVHNIMFDSDMSRHIPRKNAHISYRSYNNYSKLYWHISSVGFFFCVTKINVWLNPFLWKSQWKKLAVSLFPSLLFHKTRVSETSLFLTHFWAHEKWLSFPRRIVWRNAIYRAHKNRAQESGVKCNTLVFWLCMHLDCYFRYFLIEVSKYEVWSIGFLITNHIEIYVKAVTNMIQTYY